MRRPICTVRSLRARADEFLVDLTNCVTYGYQMGAGYEIPLPEMRSILRAMAIYEQKRPRHRELPSLRRSRDAIYTALNQFIIWSAIYNEVEDILVRAGIADTEMDFDLGQDLALRLYRSARWAKAVHITDLPYWYMVKALDLKHDMQRPYFRLKEEL